MNELPSDIRIIVPGKVALHAIVRTNRSRADQFQMIPSGRIRRSGLPSLGTLPLHPFANIGRAMNHFNALIVAAIQEPNHFDVHQRDIAQVQNLTRAARAQRGSNEADKIRTKPAAQLKSCGASFGAFFNPQHFTHGPLTFCPSRSLPDRE